MNNVLFLFSIEKRKMSSICINGINIQVYFGSRSNCLLWRRQKFFRFYWLLLLLADVLLAEQLLALPQIIQLKESDKLKAFGKIKNEHFVWFNLPIPDYLRVVWVNVPSPIIKFCQLLWYFLQWDMSGRHLEREIMFHWKFSW